jgi:Ca-activated chloride channel homolog
MKNRMNWLYWFFSGVIALFLAGPVYGEKGNDKTLSPYFFIAGGDPSVDQFPLKETNVVVNVNGVIADIYVTQTYSNEGTRPVNGRYVFPASTRASVHGMKMVIGDHMVTAKIKERQSAKQEFEKAKEEGKSASLLEQQRPNVFTMNVANIMPQDVVQIELHYTELITPTEGTYEFIYPTVVGPRYSNQPEANASETDKWVKSPYLKEGKVPPTKFNISVILSTGIPLQELVCTSHKVDVFWETKSVAKVSLSKSGEFNGNRDFILNYRLTGKEIQCGLMLYEGEGENFFLLMVQPPERIKQADIPPRESIFILDVSGSMHGFPLDTAKVLIKDLINHLRQTDKFNLILFSGSSSVMAPSSVPATKENILKALQLIDAQRGGGGTELSPALKKALSLPRDEESSRIVIIITDGYIAAEKDVFELIQNNLNKTNFFSFGIGSAVNRYLIEGMAKAGLGEPFVVTKAEEAHGAAERFREYVQSPLLTNIQVKYEGFETYHVEPPGLPDLFAQRPLILFGKWRGRPEGEIEVSGKSGKGHYVRTFQVSETKPLKVNSALRYLWARLRIARLSDFNFGKENPETKEEITSLGLTYSLLTPHTSFIAVLETIRNPEGKSKDVDQPLPLPLNVSDLAVGGEYGVGPEPEMVLLIGIALLVLLLIALQKRYFTKVLEGYSGK